MDSQFYTAAAGLLLEQRRLELITNNLANVSTPGFRAQRDFARVFQKTGASTNPLADAANVSVAIGGSYDVPGGGAVEPTGRDLDVALADGDLLVVDTPAGRRYTRAGNLSVQEGGALVDAGGRPVRGPDGTPITGVAPNAAIAADGRVRVGGAEVGRLAVVRDPKGVLVREGNNLLSADGRDAELQTVDEPKLRPASLEGSGTDAMTELVNLIEAQRAFESYQKLISATMNEVNRRAVTDLAG